MGEAVEAGQAAQSDAVQTVDTALEAATGEDVKTQGDGEAVAAAKDPKTVNDDHKAPAPRTVEAPSNDQKGRPPKQRGKFKSNNKFDPTALPDTDDPAQIRKQVEFYFSDSNLPNDRYMWQMTGGEKNTPMKLKTICGFKRMHRFKPYSAIVAALRDSEELVVSGAEGEEEIQRKKAYSSSTRDEGKELAATVYVKGFGEEQPSTVFDIEAWFVKYGPVNVIRLRRKVPGKEFKGSVFVEFQTEELAQQFLTLEPRPQWQGRDLIIMSKKAYLEEKEKQDASKRRGRGGDDVDPKDWKKRRELDQKNGSRNQQRGRGGRGGRGGPRGRGGRGGRGSHGRDHQHRDQTDEHPGDANKEVEQPAAEGTNDIKEKAELSEKAPESRTDTAEAAATGNHGATGAESASANGKRGREHDGDADERPVKKPDTKDGSAAAES